MSQMMDFRRAVGRGKLPQTLAEATAEERQYQQLMEHVHRLEEQLLQTRSALVK
jgi:hypothetical protein